MRREGRIHGMVRTYPVLSSPCNPRPNPRNLNVVTSPPTAGLFNKVSSKPTNHSKFTGKCGRSMCRDCHVLPPNGKSKDKSKGSKIRSVSQNGLIKGLIAWRVVAENQEGTGVKGRSGSGMLGYLAADEDYDYEYDDDLLDVQQDSYYDNVQVSYDQEIEKVNSNVGVSYDQEIEKVNSNVGVSYGEEIDDGDKVVEEEIVDGDGNVDELRVCDEVGIVLQSVDEADDWFLVEQDMIV